MVSTTAGAGLLYYGGAMKESTAEAWVNLIEAIANLRKTIRKEMRKIVIGIWEKLFPGHGIKWMDE